MNSSITEKDQSRQSAGNGDLSDTNKLLRLAFNSFSKEKYSMAIDYCRKTVNGLHGSESEDQAVEAYYLWCLSNLKLNKMDDAKKVCYEARRKMGNYLDLVYFELLIAAVKGDINKIPRFAKSYMDLFEAANNEFDHIKERTADKVGEVLLMSGQALEQSQKYTEALKIYKKYLKLYPNDDPIQDRVNSLEADSGQ